MSGRVCHLTEQTFHICREIYRMFDNMKEHDQVRVMNHYDLHGGSRMRWFLSGQQTMPRYDDFTCAVSYKEDCSIRIPGLVALHGKGYLEDRRPMADADPYDVIRALATSALLPQKGLC